MGEGQSSNWSSEIMAIAQQRWLPECKISQKSFMEPEGGVKFSQSTSNWMNDSVQKLSKSVYRGHYSPQMNSPPLIQQYPSVSHLKACILCYMLCLLIAWRYPRGQLFLCITISATLTWLRIQILTFIHSFWSLKSDQKSFQFWTV